MNNRPFAETLDRLLEERSWSQRELSKRLTKEFPPGIHHVTISSMYRGTMHPSMRAMELIAKTMRVDPAEFAEYRLEARRDQLNWRKHGLRKALKALDK